jgi:hypothetical protein
MEMLSIRLSFSQRVESSIIGLRPSGIMCSHRHLQHMSPRGSTPRSLFLFVPFCTTSAKYAHDAEAFQPSQLPMDPRFRNYSNVDSGPERTPSSRFGLRRTSAGLESSGASQCDLFRLADVLRSICPLTDWHLSNTDTVH